MDARASTEHLQQLAATLELPGRSKMNKDKLVDSIQKANGRRTKQTWDSLDQLTRSSVK